jgi:hypothetical protein
MKLIYFSTIVILLSSCNLILGSLIIKKTQKPVSDLKVIYEFKSDKIIDSIEDFNVNLIDGKFNLLKTEGLVSVDIKGYINDSTYFKKIYVIENLISKTKKLNGLHNRNELVKEIIIIPTFCNRKKRKDNTTYFFEKGKTYFKTKLEFKIYSNNFGLTKYRIRINDTIKELEIFHTK